MIRGEGASCCVTVQVPNKCPGCCRNLDNCFRHTASNTISLTPIRIGLSDDEHKAICFFVNSGREKQNTNPQANLVFKMDKRDQFSLADFWICDNLGTYLSMRGLPTEYRRVSKTWR